jgi:hypothetical protein
MTPAEVKELLEELVSSFRAYHTEAFREVQSPAEQRLIKEKAMKSRETLLCLFRRYSQVNDEFLTEEGSAAEISIINTLVSLVESVMQERPGGLESVTWSRTAMTVEDLSRDIDPFIQDPINERSPMIWPFVRIIRSVGKLQLLRASTCSLKTESICVHTS